MKTQQRRQRKGESKDGAKIVIYERTNLKDLSFCYRITIIISALFIKMNI